MPTKDSDVAGTLAVISISALIALPSSSAIPARQPRRSRTVLTIGASAR